MVNFKDLFSFTRKEIALVFGQGAFVARNRSLKLITKPLDTTSEHYLTHAKLLIVTPRRIGKAHDRNLLRRRVKEIVYSNELYTKTGGLFVLFTYPGSTNLTYEELKLFLLQAFARASHAPR